jgi:Ca2+-binding RTX toxin-like protein
MTRTSSLSMLAATVAVAGGMTLGGANAYAADEGTAAVNGGSLDFQAASGDVANNVTLTQPSAARLVLRDSGAAIVAGAGCVQIDEHRVRCAAAGVTGSRLELDGGDDVALVLAGIATREDGGPGADRLTGGPVDDDLRGEDGNDRLRGGEGTDALDGSAGVDHLDGQGGADSLDGGADVDTVTYAGRTEPVTVTIDDVANDGGASDGAADDVAVDVENVIGGSGDDSLTGSGAANRLTGRPGADILRGLGGADVLVANDGAADLELDCGGGIHDVVLVDPMDPQSVGCETVRT